MNKHEILYPVENVYRQHMLLDGIWFFAFHKEGVSGWEQGIPKDRVITVPANAADLCLAPIEREYTGYMWYQKDVFVPKPWLGQDVFLRLDGVAHRFILYINGMEVTRVEGGYIPNAIEITRHLRYGETNSIVLKVNNECSEQTVPRGKTILLENGKLCNRIGSHVEPLSGLIGSVHIYAVPNTRVLDYQVKTVAIYEDRAEIHYSIHVQGNCLVTATLRNREGKVVATGVGGNATLTVENPHLWTIGDGYLYRIDFEVSRLGKQNDNYTVQFGIRRVTCENGKLLLNNIPLYIKALPMTWKDYTFHGVSQLTAFQKKLKIMKREGYNCLIGGHYPLGEELVRLADLEGILLIEQVPLSPLKKVEEKSYVANFSSASDEKHQKSLINKVLLNHNKYAAATFSYGLTLPLLSQNDSATDLYKETLAYELQKSENYGRLFTLFTNLSDRHLPEIIVDQVQIIVIRGLWNKDEIEELTANTLWTALHKRILEIQHQFPNKAIIVEFDYFAHKETVPSYVWEDAYKEFADIIHSESNVRGEVLLGIV